MPMYDFQCGECKSVTSRFRKIAERHAPLMCACKGNMELALFSAPAARVQPEAHYVCPATGEQVTSWRQRKNNFAKNGLEEANSDQQDELKQRRMKKKAKRDALAKDYLPKELQKQIGKIGQNSDNPFIS